MATHLKMLGVSTCCCNILLLSLLIVLNKSCTINSYQNKFIFRSSQRIERNNNIRSTVIANEILFTCSTVISPPKVDKTKNKGVGVEVPISPDIFKENRDIQKEFDNYGNDDKYAVILYNDPFNKRIYVATCLMEVFTWTEEMAAGPLLLFLFLILLLYCMQYCSTTIIILPSL